MPAGIHPLAVDLAPAAGVAALQELAAAAALRAASGQPLRFAAADDASGYEARIWHSGLVATRPGDPHDFFNALAWINFPRAKAALNARHVAALARPVAAGTRDRERDALTHFDECGAVVLACDPGLLELLRACRWRALFCERRADVIRDMALVVFGHATRDALRAPFRGLTAKCLLEEVSADWFDAPVAARIADVDARIVRRLDGAPALTPRELRPLPLLGWPGIVAASEDPAYYDDSWQFRPGRRGARPAPV